MSNLSKPTGTAPVIPPDFAAQLSAGIAESRATTVVAGGGKPLLRMGKDGIWIFGPSNDEVIEDSLWCVNTMTLAHGYCCWVDAGEKNVLAGEIMVSMTQPKPQLPEPIHDTPFTEQRSMELRCMSGDDAGLEVLYKTASIGGMRAMLGLLDEIQQELNAYRKQPPGSVAYVFPVIRLENDDYIHPKFGKTYNPILTVVAWVDTEGNERPEPEPAPLPEQLTRPVRAEPAEPGPARRRTRAKANGDDAHATVPPQGPPVTPEPVSTQQAHVGQRRRPVAR